MMPAIAASLEPLFEILLTAAIAGGVVIVAVAGLCRMTSRLTPATRCTLWWLAALKLIVALVWIEPVVLRVLPANDSPSLLRSYTETSLTLTGSHKSGQTKGARAAVDDTLEISWRAAAAAMWILGAIASLPVMLGRIRRTSRVVAGAGVVSPDLEQVVRELCEQTGVRRVQARRSDEIDAPMIAGLLRPVIVLPATRFDALSSPEQRMAICHELVHLRRGDLWLGCVPALAQCLFFFHPLAVLAAREYLLAREAARDRAVLQLLNAAPQDYGRLLLALGVSPMRPGLAAAGSSRSFSNLKRRVAMLGHRSPSSLSRAGGSLIAGVAACALIPIQLAQRPSTDSPKLLALHLSPWPWAANAERSPAPVASPPVAPTAQKKEPAEERGERLEFVLVNRNRQGVTMSGSDHDAERVKRTYGGERVLWFRHGGKGDVVKDPAALDETEQIYRPVAEIGAKQGEVGAKQGAIGAKQGAVGAKQGEIGAKQGAIGAKQGAIGARQGMLAAREVAELTDAERRELEAEHERLAKEMDALNEEMSKLNDEMRRASEPMDEFDDEMRRLSSEMEGLSRQMNEATAKADSEMRALFERLIKNGVAQVEP